MRAPTKVVVGFKKVVDFFMLMWRGFAGFLVALRVVGWVVGGIFGSFFLV